DGEHWKVPAWEELVAGMRRKYGVAWPRLLRDPADPRDGDGDGPPDAPVVVVGTPGSGSRAVHRALNLLGLPPVTAPDQRRLDALAGDLGLDARTGYLPGTPDEVLEAPGLVAALEDVRAAVRASRRPGRPTLWKDLTGGALVPFLAAAYDADPCCVLVVRNPLDVADELRVESALDRRTALAVWERRTRLALRSLVGLPVVVTRLEDLVTVPVAWSRSVHRALTGLGVPLLGGVADQEVAAAVRGGIRSARHDDVPTTTPEQEQLYALLLSLGGAHARFPDLELTAESAGTEQLLLGTAPPAGPPVRLGPEWVDWVAENRDAGIEDAELLAVLVQRGLAPGDGWRALAALDGTSSGRPHRAAVAERTYRSVNARAWDLLSGTTDDFGRPVVETDPPGARAELEGPVPIPWDGVRRALCLGGGGGRQGVLLASLGLEVVVADLSAAQLALDRDAAERLGLSLRTVQTDMADLGRLADASFDLVHQPVSLCYVPDPAAVFAEVARVLRPGGHYWVENWNPVQMQLDHLGRSGPPYRLVRPQDPGRPVRFGFRAEELGPDAPDDVAWHYVHPLATLLGSMCDAGFEIDDLQERRYGDSDAVPGTEEHLGAHVPPFFTVLARRVGVAP
ncbi:MAG: methyltransferase domain-containing protein, partial [Marmoricola sp.]|nr:methyltransferase domain-containing protein [Marmoricola sp.]